MSWASSVVLKFRGAEKWPEIEASVRSYDSEYMYTEAGGYIQTTMTFTYRVDGELYTAKSSWGKSDGAKSLQCGDSITVRYDPKNPSRAWFPEKQELDLPFLFMFFMACSAGVFLIFSVLIFVFGHGL